MSILIAEVFFCFLFFWGEFAVFIGVLVNISIYSNSTSLKNIFNKAIRVKILDYVDILILEHEFRLYTEYILEQKKD